MRRAAVVAALLLVAACGGAPSAPSAPSGNTVPQPASGQFTGLWVGTYRYTKCQGLRDCAALLPNWTESFTLRLEQAGSSVSGVFESRWFAISVAGAADASGRVTLSGSGAPASALDYYDTVNANFTVAIDAGHGLAGSVEYRRSGAGPFSSDSNVIDYAATIISAIERPLDDLSGWTGTWRGRFVVRSCTSIGWNGFCVPEDADSVGPLTLTITDAGQVSGHLTLVSRVIPITGQITWGTLQLTGELSQPESGGPLVTRIVSFDGTSDRFGRLTGAFHYVVDWQSAPPAHVTTYDAEVWEVVKQPG